MSACIIPVAPEFEDPVAVKNYPPVIDNAEPPFGSVVSPDPTNSQGHFRVRISDPNLSDTLQVVLLADYPPKNINTRSLQMGELQDTYPPVQPPSTDPVRAHDVSFDVGCDPVNLVTGLSEHRIVLMVFDRDWTLASGQYVPKTADGLMATGNWLLTLTCQ